jgi:hypothetical protein
MGAFDHPRTHPVGDVYDADGTYHPGHDGTYHPLYGYSNMPAGAQHASALRRFAVFGGMSAAVGLTALLVHKISEARRRHAYMKELAERSAALRGRRRHNNQYTKGRM